MSLTALPQARLAAAIALLAALGLALGIFTLSRSQASTSEQALTPLPAHVKRTQPAARPVAHPRKQPSTPSRRRPVRPAVAVPSVDKGLPAALGQALRRHRTVVVSLYTPGAAVDREALAEARAGAALAGSGFAAIDVLRESQAKRLTTLLNGSFEGPAVLVVNRPGRLVMRLDGFADRETVAQAAANARP